MNLPQDKVAHARDASPAHTAFPLLTWAHFLNDGYVNYVPAILPALMAAHHFPLAMAGTLVLALQGVTAMFQPAVGLWADRLGSPVFVWAGLALSALGASAVGVAPSAAVLLGLLLVTGIGNTLFHPQALAAASAAANRRRGLRMSVFLVSGELGRGLGPVLASALVAWQGLHSLWLLLVPSAVTVPFLARAPLPIPRHPDGKAPPLSLRGRGVPAGLIVLFNGLRALAAFGVLTFVPILWHERGGSLVAGASLVTVLLVVGIAGNLAGGWLADRVGRRRWLVVSSVLASGLLALFLAVRGPWSWVVMGVMGIALFSSLPVTMLLTQDLFPENRSMASGLALGSGNAVGAFATFLLGPVAAAIGVPGTLLLVAGGVLLAGCVALFLPDRQPVDAHLAPTPAR